MESANITSKGQLVVPSKLRRKYGIKRGTKIVFIEKGSQILFQPVTPEYIRSVCGMLKSATSVGSELVASRRGDKVKENSLEKLGSR